MLASRLIVDLAGAELAGSADVHGGCPRGPSSASGPSAPTASSASRSRPTSSAQILERLGFEVDGRRGTSPSRPGARAT